MMAFAKTLEDKWTTLGLIKSQFARKDNSPRSTGQLVSHRPVTFTYGTLFDIFCMLYEDDSAFVFESSTGIKKRITLFSDYFTQFGLKIHLGTKKIPQILNAYSSCLHVSLIHEQNRSLTSPTPLWPSRRKNREKETHARGQRIYQVQRNINHQSKMRICKFHQALKVLGGLYIILSPRRLRHRHTPSSSKIINGIPRQILNRC